MDSRQVAWYGQAPMLTSLHIKDFAIIDELSVELKPGLNIMTGETGAGKTIIVEAIKLVLGGRGQADAIRARKDQASVTAVFDGRVLPTQIRHELDRAGIGPGDDLIIHRVVSTKGRGRAAINGVPVTSGLLRKVSEHLVDVSSQHEHQLLLDPVEHAAVVDAYGGLRDEARAYIEAHREYAGLKRCLDELIANERVAREKFDYLKFQLDELKAADLKAGEDMALEAERSRTRHAVTLEERSRAAESLLYRGASSALELVDRASGFLSQCEAFDPEVGRWGAALTRARDEIETVARELSSYADGLEADPARLEEVEERIHLIRRLVRKHGGSIEACLKRKDEIASEMDAIERYDDIMEEKRTQLDELAAKRRGAARAWNKRRKMVAELLGKAVSGELANLGMPKTEFEVKLEPRAEPEWDELGPDRIEFLISPNVGEPLLPLVRIASGGELSRAMLAIKSALADKARLAGTSVFDEVDAGIGGAVAEVVGRKLKEVASSRQVICITHLPQIAVHGKHHLRVSKRVKGGRTVAVLEPLPFHGRLEEIARMLGGTKVTEATRKHASEMLLNATRGA